MSLPFFLISSIFILNSLQQANGVNLSPGCGKTLPEQPRPGKHHKFSVSYQDKILGDVERNYIIQIPRGIFMYMYNGVIIHKYLPIYFFIPKKCEIRNKF